MIAIVCSIDDCYNIIMYSESYSMIQDYIMHDDSCNMLPDNSFNIMHADTYNIMLDDIV